MAKPSRDEFSAKTKRDLAARAGHVCCFPKCGSTTSGPSAEAHHASVNLGEACHIRAAASGPGARRYDPSMTSDERRSIENGIWMCRTHAKLIDSDEATYTVEQLHRWKHEAEARAELRLRSGSAAAQWGAISRSESGSSPRHIELKREKLDCLRAEEAITADAEKKFELRKKIEALEAEIADDEALEAKLPPPRLSPAVEAVRSARAVIETGLAGLASGSRGGRPTYEDIEVPFTDRRSDEERRVKLSKYQGYGTPARPLSTQSERELAYAELARRLKELEGQPVATERLEAEARSKPWNVPHQCNQFFTGREDVIERLHEALHAKGSAALGQAISGLGGIGKTQTAVEYCARHREEYRVVLWARAETEAELVQGLVEIARVLDLPEKDAQDQEAVQAVRRWLGREDSWLLVLDNADTPAMLKPFLPTPSMGHLLLTSRAQNFDVLEMAPFKLEVLPADDALAFLLRRARRGDPSAPEKKAAGELAAELGYLPLALEQAGAYLSLHDSRFTDYLASYRRRRLQLLSKGPLGTIVSPWRPPGR